MDLYHHIMVKQHTEEERMRRSVLLDNSKNLVLTIQEQFLVVFHRDLRASVFRKKNLRVHLDTDRNTISLHVQLTGSNSKNGSLGNFRLGRIRKKNT